MSMTGCSVHPQNPDCPILFISSIQWSRECLWRAVQCPSSVPRQSNIVHPIHTGVKRMSMTGCPVSILRTQTVQYCPSVHPVAKRMSMTGCSVSILSTQTVQYCIVHPIHPGVKRMSMTGFPVSILRTQTVQYCPSRPSSGQENVYEGLSSVHPQYPDRPILSISSIQWLREWLWRAGCPVSILRSQNPDRPILSIPSIQWSREGPWCSRPVHSSCLTCPSILYTVYCIVNASPV